MSSRRILIVRLGAMGDILHALPAVAALRRTFADARIDWAVHPKWRDLLAGNPLDVTPIYIDRRKLTECHVAVCSMRNTHYDVAVDLQGLIQSALVARLSGAAEVYGYDPTQVREWPGALLYTKPVRTTAPHVVERCAEIAVAAGAVPGSFSFPLPTGAPEGELPARYVLAAPFAGWRSKQWPVEHYSTLARRLRDELGLTLVLNVAPNALDQLSGLDGIVAHTSSIAGLIHATRHATAVVGLDSGPMHLAAALAKPGVALFGPTDPQRNGPYGGTLTVLRDAQAVTTYKRGAEIDASMRALTPDMVFRALAASLARMGER